MTCGSVRTTAGGPSAMTWPNSRTTTRSQMPSTSPMSCSISSIDWPWSARPRLLCLDEPAAGLDTRESAELGACLRGLADQGQSMLLIEHDMGLVLGICDRVVVLEFGQVIADGPPEAVRTDPRVIAAYLGRGVTSEGAPAFQTEA